MSEKEKVAAGRWEIPEKPFRYRYLRAIVDGDSVVARWRAAREAEREEGPETGPADLSGEM